MRVLVTGATGVAGQRLISQLTHRGITVIATDVHPTPPHEDGVEVIPVPAVDDPRRLSALRHIVATERISLFIPTVREELPQLAAARSAFPSSVQIAVANPGAVMMAHDNLYTAWQLQARGVAVPKFGPVSDFTNAENAFKALGGPLISRPRVPGGDARVQVAANPAELDWEQLGADDLLQRAALGTQYTGVVYRPQARRGGSRVIAVLEETLLPGARTSTDTLVRRVDVNEAEDVARTAVAAVRALGLTGAAEVTIRRGTNGTPQVLSVDARFGRHSADVPDLLDQVLASATSEVTRS